MHHGVGELRIAPTLTASAYSTLEYHGLRGVLDQGDHVVDQLTYWRLDSGAGTSWIPGIALRFDSTLWFGDDQPFVPLDPTTASDEQRKQDVSSTLSGVMDIFPGEWIKKLSGLKLNAAYSYTLQASSQGLRRGTTAPLIGQEICDNGLDDDGNGLVDCADPKCALSDACLLRTGQLKSHRVYGTAYWEIPGKVQAEVFADIRQSYSNRDDVLRSSRQEFRSYVTWRPIYPSPITLRCDVQHESKRPEQYDSMSADPVQPEVLVIEPALEWRRRWSPKWWHLAKISVSHSRTSDLPHIRTIEDPFGRKGDLERLDFNDVAFTPSIEVRRRFEDDAGKWNLRPYARVSYKMQWGQGVRSRIDTTIREAGTAGMADGSETSRTLAVSLGFIWVHSEHLYVDLDVTTSYYACVRAATGALCSDKVTLSPHLLATARY
jgi:hypothetical protein